jgi:hypothetical protein
MKNLTNKQFLEGLRKLLACDPAVEWVKQHGGSAADCWHDCDNGSWMGWLIGYMKLYESPQKLSLCLADIIKPCSKILPEAGAAEKTLRLYATGKATIEKVNAAAEAAGKAAEAAGWAAGRATEAAGWAAGRAAEAAGWAALAAGRATEAAGWAAGRAAEAAGWAALAAGRAALAAGRATEAAGWAAEAASRATEAAGWAAEAAGKAASLRHSANVFRKHYPAPFAASQT